MKTSFVKKSVIKRVAQKRLKQKSHQLNFRKQFFFSCHLTFGKKFRLESPQNFTKLD